MNPREGLGEVIERLRRSTVVVRESKRGSGSGVVVDSSGLIVTNAHVAVNANPLVELWDGSKAKAILRARNAEQDLAILQVDDENLPAVKFGDPGAIRSGELVIAVGNPFGFVGAVTTGVVHAVGPMRGLGKRNWVQSAVRLAPGNSGGPLANARGEIVGVNTMLAGGLALAIPAPEVLEFVTAWSRGSSLGIIGRQVPITVNGKLQAGVVIMEIVKGSSAELAALLPGDIIVGLDGQPLYSKEHLEQHVQGSEGQILRLQFVRGDRCHIRSVAVVPRSRRSRAA
ncbi:MAG: trypsin-like peptidase domain-containing protein [Bacteroidota bacterium]